MLCSSPSYSPKTVYFRTLVLVHAPYPALGIDDFAMKNPLGVVNLARPFPLKLIGSCNLNFFLSNFTEVFSIVFLW